MYAIRRWWTRHGIRLGLIALALGTAWAIRQTQGTWVMEAYRWLAQPLEGSATSDEVLESARNQELHQRILELESQNRELKQLLGYKATLPQEGVAAPVIGRGADHWWQQVTLGRGRLHGIKTGAIVTSTGGLVGRVIHVTDHTSRVLLISDPSSQVGVNISRSRYMGYMRGRSENRAVMEFFDKVPDVRPGDVITTSSFSQLFPAGWPVGRVESIDLTKSPAPEATIAFSTPLNRLEWVVVYPNPNAPAP